MTGTPLFRRAAPGDADALATCIDAAYAQYADQIDDLPPVSAGIEGDIAHNQVWVAIAGDELIGGLVLVRQDSWMKLANIAVHPDSAGVGLGRALIELAESEAKRQGCDEIRLNTHVNMPENIELYSHLGWTETGRNGNTVSMSKRL